MVTLLNEIHFWTTQEDVIVKNSDWGSFKYYTKKDGDESLISQSKKQYCEQRGLVWIPLNKRPQKFRDRLKELEEHLIHNRIVHFSWEDSNLRLLLSTGLLVTLTINSNSADISNIVFDKQLSTKLQVNIICDGTIIGNQVICICNDGHMLGFGGHWKDGWVLEGGPRKRLNYYSEWLAVWGKAGAEHPQPWSPLAKNHQRANLHLYWIGARDPELLAYKKTDGEPLEVIVSKIRGRTLVLVEQKVTQRGAVAVEVSELELVGNNLKRISVTSVPLQTQVSCTSMSKLEDRLLICCIDGSLALLDRNRGSTRTIKATFIPTLSVWHPAGTVVAISNERGQLQYYDTALNCLKNQLVGEDCTPTAIVDFSSYFSTQFSVASLSWGPKDLIIALEQGPIAIVKHVDRSLSFEYLLQRYLMIGKVDKAIKLLLSWDFNESSFFALQRIVTYLLRMPLTEETAQHLQNALGSFHNSPVPISPQMRHRYRNQVISLTRRFFHQLVRAEMFETAFLLAVDVGHHDLFMDLYYIAVKIGETEMAAAARAQASALLSRCSSEASNCSRSSCSQCSDSTSSSSEEYASNNEKEDQKVGNRKNNFIRFPLNSDNSLTTDFNQPNPTTYQSVQEPENNTVCLQSDYQRLNCPPKATYVRSPQVPSDFVKKTANHNVTNHNSILTPPLPFAPSLPNLAHSSLGIPYMSHPVIGSNFKSSNHFQYNAQTTNSHGNIFSSANMSGGIFMSTNKTANNTKLTQSSMAYTVFSPSNATTDNKRKNSMAKVLTPPLPNIGGSTVTPPADLIFSTNTNHQNDVKSAASSATENCEASTTINKKQPKVKFSDTVTAFIVPEIKRPQRPVPPSHVTNPQKELADSLPLCHPNEDYLKDFTPVRKDDSNEESDGSQPAKIKVVHFGVV